MKSERERMEVKGGGGGGKKVNAPYVFSWELERCLSKESTLHLHVSLSRDSWPGRSQLLVLYLLQ